MVVIIDYGMGNLSSVQKAGESLGYRLRLTDSAALIKKADKIIFPGVAHFGRTVKELKKRKLPDLLRARIKEGVPFFGICVGMQVLLEKSEEAPGVSGLGVIKGSVKRFSKQGLIVPHMGWNQVKLKTKHLFKGVPDGSYFYFANSYYCAPKDKSVIAATTDYGVLFASAIFKDNVWGVQFHPEKSQELGLRVLNNFLNQD